MSDNETNLQQKESGAVYVCERHPGFFFRLNGKRFQFEKHQLKVDDAEDVKAIDELLEKNSAFAQKIKKVDIRAAEALVEKHKREHGGAVSGPFSSDLMAKMEANRLAARDDQFNHMPDGQADAIKTALEEESNLKVTHKAKQAEQVHTEPVSESASESQKSGLNLKKS